jgi:hypothetical protein
MASHLRSNFWLKVPLLLSATIEGYRQIIHHLVPLLREGFHEKKFDTIS